MWKAAKKAWNGDETLARAFWLWGIGGNALYVIFFLVWPLEVMRHLSQAHDEGLIFGGLFVVFSQIYMIFSITAGMRTALKQPRPFDVKVWLALMFGIAIFLMGELLWAMFSSLLYIMLVGPLRPDLFT